MARQSKRVPLVLKHEEKKHLVQLSQSRTAPGREVERANILLHYADGMSIQAIHRELRLSRPTIYKCIDKLWPLEWQWDKGSDRAGHAAGIRNRRCAGPRKARESWRKNSRG